VDTLWQILLIFGCLFAALFVWIIVGAIRLEWRYR